MGRREQGVRIFTFILTVIITHANNSVKSETP